MSATPPRRQSIPRPPSSPLRPSSPSTPTTPPAPGLSQVSPRRSSAPAVPSTPPPKSRARDLLRKHYGLGIGPPPPLRGRKLDPMDFGALSVLFIFSGVSSLSTKDSPAFDAKTYYEQLITTSSLPMLLKRNNELIMGN